MILPSKQEFLDVIMSAEDCDATSPISLRFEEFTLTFKLRGKKRPIDDFYEWLEKMTEQKDGREVVRMVLKQFGFMQYSLN